MKHINLSVLGEMTGNNSSSMKKYVDLFLSMAPSEFLELHEAVVSEEFDNIRIRSHTLKTKIEMMGANELLEFISEIERLAEEKIDMLRIQQTYFQAENEFKLVKMELEEY